MSEADNPLQGVITKCWEDEAFKERLLADPAATLAAEGVPVPEGMTVHVAFDTEDERTLVIPLPPAPVRLADEDVDDLAVAGALAGGWNPSVDYVDIDPGRRLDTGGGSFTIDFPDSPGQLRYYKSSE
jgi:hypothetical protein